MKRSPRNKPGPGRRSRFAARFLRAAIAVIYKRRHATFAALMAVTAAFFVQALHLQVDAGFEKQIPLGHPYMKVFEKYKKAFGGANLVSVALISRDGDIYNARLLDRLQKVTDEIFFLPGVDRSRVRSLMTPGVRYLEIVEGGIESGDVVPRNYKPSPEMFRLIRANVGKAGLIGRLVSSDQRGALVTAELLEHDPATGAKLDYRWVAQELEKIRGRIQSPVKYELRAKRDFGPFRAGDVVATAYSDPGWTLPLTSLVADRRNANEPPVRVRGWNLAAARVPNPDYTPGIGVHIIGFAKIIGDVTDASLEVIGFFGLALLLTLLLLWLFCGSLRLSLLPLSAALAAVVWELGLLRTVGFGLDPFAILVPFLILSIGVSHGVQYINGWGHEVAENGRDSYQASLKTFRRLFIPGSVAIITDVIGFATLAFIKIEIVQEMAINAALGMAAVIVTNKMMLPIVLTWVRLADVEKFRRRQAARRHVGDRIWRHLSVFATPRAAVPFLLFCAAALGWSFMKYKDLRVGELQEGVPELRPDSRYNRDARIIAGNFHIGVDLMKVIAESKPYACVDHDVMETVLGYAWRMQNTPGVQSVVSLPQVALQLREGWNEGNPKWRALPRNPAALAQITNPVPTSLGLQNANCSVMPVLLFTSDHRAETIRRIVGATQLFNAANADRGVNFALASGNVGVMAATNEEIEAREIVVLVWVHLTLLVFVWLSFRSVPSVVSIILPLVTCSLLTYGYMAVEHIGMKSATLPVAAFGVGIGVDDGIYLWSVLARYLFAGAALQTGYFHALRTTGRAVIFTSLSLIVSVSTWLLSGLQFQADMGQLLLYMFTTNLFGAILMLPALAWLTSRRRPQRS